MKLHRISDDVVINLDGIQAIVESIMWNPDVEGTEIKTVSTIKYTGGDKVRLDIKLEDLIEILKDKGVSISE